MVPLDSNQLKSPISENTAAEHHRVIGWMLQHRQAGGAPSRLRRQSPLFLRVNDLMTWPHWLHPQLIPRQPDTWDGSGSSQLAHTHTVWDQFSNRTSLGYCHPFMTHQTAINFFIICSAHPNIFDCTCWQWGKQENSRIFVLPDVGFSFLEIRHLWRMRSFQSEFYRCVSKRRLHQLTFLNSK